MAIYAKNGELTYVDEAGNQHRLHPKTIIDNVDGLRRELDGQLTLDGSRAMTGHLPMGGNKITGLGTPTANTDAANKAYADQKRPKVVIVKTTGKSADDYKEEGIYFFDIGYLPSNVPESANGWLEVIPSTTNGMVKQIWYRAGTPGTNDHHTHVRTYAPSKGWGTWDYYMTSKGGTMTGDLNMGGKKITNLAQPSANTDPATKVYVDNSLAAKILPLEQTIQNLSQQMSTTTGILELNIELLDSTLSQKTTALEQSVETLEGNLKVVNANLSEAVQKAAPYNLLDNSDFSQIVDQRGAASYTGAGYGFDRWVSIAAGLTAKKLVYTDPNTNTKTALLQLKETGGSAVAAYGQRISPELSDWMRGKKFTFAVCKLDGKIITCSGTCSAADLAGDATQIQFSTNGTDDVYRIEVIKVASTQCFTARIWVNAGGTVALRWAALYEGEYVAQTLPSYRPKGYAVELNECRRYYQKFGNSVKTGVLTTDCKLLRLGIPLPVPLRLTKPTMTITNASGLRTVNGANFEPTVTASTVSIYADGSALVDLTVNQIAGATNNTPIAMYFSAELSAEL